ncbi:MAG TPA: alpha-ribazole phosphatase [bacterium]|nr:alpha-ribazole phosphatase [bacterium]
MRLYLVRHGETVGTVKKKYHGHTDVPLDAVGFAQVRRLGAHLRKVRFEAAYVSDLLRCRQTAQAVIGRRKIPVQFRKGLREIHFGDWEGKSFLEMQSADVALFEKWVHDLPNFTMPGGESTRAMEERITREIERIVKRHREGNVLVVSHGGPIRVALCSALTISMQHFWRMSVDTASVSVVECADGFCTVKLLNMVV